ncbi:hypothetical protein AMATHDRAFT_69774 [Amanita thiersii Skay4041]|uniref:Uncharacterized protein n=1 Tax=Amanita thiersii Skay4041 TaxID=703135 RepID=A0A2A9NFI8_9AGAR|nr:hypothetical protein AMATHDRAFT_69774 [Amanita thiersii Skay4041]
MDQLTIRTIHELIKALLYIPRELLSCNSQKVRQYWIWFAALFIVGSDMVAPFLVRCPSHFTASNIDVSGTELKGKR